MNIKRMIEILEEYKSEGYSEYKEIVIRGRDGELYGIKSKELNFDIVTNDAEDEELLVIDIF